MPTQQQLPGLAWCFPLLLSALLPWPAMAATSSPTSDTALRVVIRESAATCQRIDGQLEGLECTLARQLAERIGSRLVLTLTASSAQAREQVLTGAADIAITGAPHHASPGLQAGPDYLDISQCLIYRYGSGRPRKLDRITAEQLVVAAAGNHVQRAERLAGQHPGLAWSQRAKVSDAALLSEVSSGTLRYTLAWSHELAAYQQIYPALRCARTVADGLSLSWTLADSNPALLSATRKFFNRIRNNGQLARLQDRYLAHCDHLDYVSVSRFLRRINTRLPNFQTLFEQAAAHTGLDWRLLAAVSYQESHWDVLSVSPTGVKGLMMLTEATARQMGIRNRLDPAQSIDGGARYLLRVKGKIPRRIAEPDRSWLALAAYNIGFGHLEDARILTQRQGGNPDHWPAVRERLPLLAKPRWSRTLRRGAANGVGAVEYVRNIRSFYAILRQQTGLSAPATAETTHPTTVANIPPLVPARHASN